MLKKNACLYFSFLLMLLIGCSKVERRMATDAMDPAIKAGEHILIDKKDKRDGPLGKIVAFKHGENTFVFRLIARSGDYLEISKGEVFVNGEKANYGEQLHDTTKVLEMQNGIAGANADNNWNKDNWGGVQIPKKGEIVSEEVVGLIPESYVDKENRLISDLMFVLGDNRNDAYDSRYIGLVPVDLLVGTVLPRKP